MKLKPEYELFLKMYVRITILLVAYLISSVYCQDIVNCSFAIDNEWPGGFSGLIKVPIRQNYSYGWIMHIKFTKPVVKFDFYEGTVLRNNKGLVYVVQHKGYNKIIDPYWIGKVIDFNWEGSQYSDGNFTVYKLPPLARVLFVPHISAEETVYEALNRVIQDGSGQNTKTVASTTQTTASTTSAALSSTTTTTTTVSNNLDDSNSGDVSSNFTATPFTGETTKATNPFRYDLREVIQKSLLFFEAQRSGTLPKNNRIKWRSHSGLKDGIGDGLDLSGGYYVDGGHVKYGLPMAFSMTVLSWGVIDFKRGYITSKQLENTMNAIKWGTDYFIKCNPDKFTLYGQLSDQNTDDSYWGRPEDSQESRPSYKLTRNNPGSDLAGETAAALAAASIVFNKTLPDYSDKLVKHAKQLYKFGDRYRKSYADSIPQSENLFKPKSGFMDELAWAAIWLYKATGEDSYLESAMIRLIQDTNENPIHTFDWDDKRAGVIMLLAQITNSSLFRKPLFDFCEYNVITGSATYTPKGFLHLSITAPTALTSNAAFICLMVAELGIRPDTYRQFAQGQLNYMLGDFDFSYMVGFGKKYPKRAFHKGSSCPDSPLPCSFADRDKKIENPHDLIGALVTGPDKWDNFEDVRTKDFNNVGIHYNAGFQTLAAGILMLQVSLQTFSEPQRGELLPKLLQDLSLYHSFGEVLRKSNIRKQNP